MKLLCLGILILGFAEVAVTARAQVPSTVPPDTGQADSVPQQAESPEQAESARSFKGTIVRAKGQLVLKESSAHTFYRLDDQKKAKQYEGKTVTVTATMDSNSNTLRVIDIVQSKRASQRTSKE